ncbi:MT-A70 family methyltransferase [Oricola sp.]|uniref:MT-A70 family methyltransferase n=1 Tax=Oricola sp. TaxID=1979950 RepID=UPI003BAB0DC1
MPDGPFDLIVADPPWRFGHWKLNLDDTKVRAVEQHYQTQSLEWICDLPVAEVAARNSHLMLWITGPMLARGVHATVLQAWGFEPSSIAFVWLKINKKSVQGRFWSLPRKEDFFMGLGHTTRQNAEYVVLGRRGRPQRHARDVHQLIIEPRREHSRKPEAFYVEAERYAGRDARRLDLFARKQRPGWTAAGNEIAKFDGVAE